MTENGASFPGVLDGQESISLPPELAGEFEPVSCLKFQEQSSTCLLERKTDRKRFLMKTASEPLIAEALINERNILEAIHCQQDPLAELFPTPLHLITVGGVCYYIRSYIEGKTLEELCESNYRKPGLTPAQALDYMISLTEQLHFLHTLHPPLIHRDIKPQNIVIDTLGRCHFIDLGISRFYGKGKRGDTVIMGTRLTAPPEQFGYQQTDIRSDLYSMGVVLLYCLTGEYEPDRAGLQNLQPAIGKIIHKATQFDPDQRYQSTNELLTDLLGARYSAFYPEEPERSSGQAAKRPAGGSRFLVSARFLIPALLLLGLCAGLGVQNYLLTRSLSTMKSATDGGTGGGTEGREAESLKNQTDGLSGGQRTTELSTFAESSPDSAAPDEVYHFKEPLIEEAVRAVLQKPEGAVTVSDLGLITQLHIIGMQIFSDDSEYWFRGEFVYARDDAARASGLYQKPGTISSLEDIAHMPNLVRLSLYGQQISDLSPLADTSIRELGIGYNPVADLSPLAGNASIEYLNAASLPLAGISVPASLPNLKRLNISGTGLSSIAGLEQCPLEELNLYDLALEDFRELRAFAGLESLELSAITEQIAEDLSGMKLRALRISHFNDLPLRVLNGLAELETLYLYNDSLEMLQTEGAVLPALKELDVTNFTIPDFTVFSALPSLQTLKVYGSVCESYDGLDDLPNLTGLSCSQEQKAEIEKLLPERSFNSINIY